MGNGYSGATAYFSADSRFIAFDSSSNNLFSNDFNNFQDVYIKDLVTGEIKLVSLDENNNQPNDHARLSGQPLTVHQCHLQLMLLILIQMVMMECSLFIAPTNVKGITITSPDNDSC